MWLSAIKLAKEGNSEAQNHLQAENKLRQEQNRPTVEQELQEIAEETELRKKIEEAEEEKKEAKESEKVIAMFEEFIRDGEKAMRAMPVPMLRDEIKRFVDHAEWDGEQLRVFLRGT